MALVGREAARTLAEFSTMREIRCGDEACPWHDMVDS